jgi:3-deoxy-D-arabino-heptulosonate 7-phosphate (DAHP) synthase class II
MDKSIGKEERLKFSSRLRESLYKAGYDDKSPTKLRRAYLFIDPNANVSVHAVRKWLIGDSIPTQNKMKLLAKWLNVSAEWLRFGEAAEQHSTENRTDILRSHEILLLSQIRSLCVNDALLVTDLVRRLASNNET